MQEVRLDYGDGHMAVELPDTATIVRYGRTYTDPPKVDPVEATRAAVMGAINPVDTPAKLASAVEALGHASLNAFQQASGLSPTPSVDAPTHFALLAALRGLGAQSPVAVPDREAAKDALVTSQPPGVVGDALLRLRTDDALTDASRQES